MINELNMKVGDLVVALSVGFEGDKRLKVGTPGLVKKVTEGTSFFNPEVLVYWMRYGYETWEHPDAVEVVSSVKK
tara:strand:- start:728 stop:952 length:225 start_codon:yes stop_codon:yes gene_type:complete